MHHGWLIKQKLKFSVKGRKSSNGHAMVGISRHHGAGKLPRYFQLGQSKCNSGRQERREELLPNQIYSRQREIEFRRSASENAVFRLAFCIHSLSLLYLFSCLVSSQSQFPTSRSGVSQTKSQVKKVQIKMVFSRQQRSRRQLHLSEV